MKTNSELYRMAIKHCDEAVSHLRDVQPKEESEYFLISRLELIAAQMHDRLAWLTRCVKCSWDGDKLYKQCQECAEAGCHQS